MKLLEQRDWLRTSVASESKLLRRRGRRGRERFEALSNKIQQNRKYRKVKGQKFEPDSNQLFVSSESTLLMVS